MVLAEVDGGLVTRYAVLAGNPPDATELLASSAHHRARFGRAPAALAAGRHLRIVDRERLAKARGWGGQTGRRASAFEGLTARDGAQDQ